MLIAETQQVIGLDAASLVSLAVGTLLPLLVGLVTTKATNATLKSLLLLALSVVSGFLSTLLGALQANVDFDWREAALTALVTFVVGVATHFGVWKPVGASDKAQAVGSTRTVDVDPVSVVDAALPGLGDQPAPTGRHETD